MTKRNVVKRKSSPINGLQTNNNNKYMNSEGPLFIRVI